MAGRCTVCTHPEVEAINAALLKGEPKRRIAADYGLSETSVHRHAARHLPATLTKAAEAEQVASADNLLAQLHALQVSTLAILDKQSKAGGDDRIALSAIREARSNLDLLGRLLGQLDNAPKIAVLVNNPEWLTLRTVILTALEPYPEAREAVIDGLKRLSS